MSEVIVEYVHSSLPSAGCACRCQISDPAVIASGRGSVLGGWRAGTDSSEAGIVLSDHLARVCVGQHNRLGCINRLRLEAVRQRRCWKRATLRRRGRQTLRRVSEVWLGRGELNVKQGEVASGRAGP